MKLNLYSAKDYENKPRLRTPAKQTQSNPIYGEQTCLELCRKSRTTCSELACPELACGELVEPVEGVEPISKWRKPCGASRPQAGLTAGTLAQGKFRISR